MNKNKTNTKLTTSVPLKGKEGRLKKMLKFSFGSLLTLAALFVFVLNVQDLHKWAVRGYVNGSIVRMTDMNRGSDIATGFFVKGETTGKTYLLTNEHVCDSGSGVAVGSVMGYNVNGQRHIAKIVDFHENSDLCLLEVTGRPSALSLGSDASAGELMAAAGHPSLMDLTLSSGEVIETTPVTVLWRFADELADCQNLRPVELPPPIF